MAFEEYWDFVAKKWVTSPGERDRINKEHGLIPAGEWKHPEDVIDEAERNYQANKSATYDGYDEAVAKALYRAEHGYEFEHTLADDIRSADRDNDPKRKKLNGD